MFLADSYPRSFRNLRVAISAFVFCLGFSFPSSAQSDRSKIDKNTIRPFKVKVPEKDLVELRRRILVTRWPDKETDSSQGVPLDRLQQLVRYSGPPRFHSR